MKKVVGFLTNKFLLTALIFGVWMTWFDQNDFGSQRERAKNLKDTKDNIAYLQKEIAGMEKEHYDLTNDPEKLERFAREEYKMKRDNEDIYVIDRK
jgi:cell division protein DivIC